METVIAFMGERSKIFLLSSLFLIVAGYIFFKIRKYQINKEYIFETLKRNGLTSDKSRISKDKIKWPNKSSESFKKENKLICQLFQNPRIIDFVAKDQTIIFKCAKFPKKVKLNRSPKTIEVGRDHDNKRFSIFDYSLLMRVSSGGGKTVFLYNMIHSYYRSEPKGSFEILISDAHQSFNRIKGIEGINVFDVTSIEEKSRFLEKIKAVKEYQRTIDLSLFETLEEAKERGSFLEKKSFFLVVDEFSESYSNANSKELDYAVNSEIISTLKDIITSGRKFNQRVLISYQSTLNSQALIHPSLFGANIYSYESGDLADAKGVNINHELLKESGNLFYYSKKYEAKFFRTPYLGKKDLLDLLTSSKT